MKIPFSFLGVLLLALLSGCASGPSFSSSSSSLPTLEAGKGRIFFYRTAVVGAAVQPAVKVNGVKVGSAKPKGVFCYDTIPGDYVIETSTEVKRSLTLKLEQGEVRYVRLNISMGFLVGHVYPELVDKGVGASEVNKCNLVETDK